MQAVGGGEFHDRQVSVVVLFDGEVGQQSFGLPGFTERREHGARDEFDTVLVFQGERLIKNGFTISMGSDDNGFLAVL